MVGETQDDRVIHQPGFFERVDHRHDVFVDDGVQVRVEIYVFAARLRGFDRRGLVEGVARGRLDARLGREIVVIVGRHFDAEVNEGITLVAGHLPDIWIDVNVVRIYQRNEQAERFAQLGRTIL